jgi:hypothetical protein
MESTTQRPTVEQPISHPENERDDGPTRAGHTSLLEDNTRCRSPTRKAGYHQSPSFSKHGAFGSQLDSSPSQVPQRRLPSGGSNAPAQATCILRFYQPQISSTGREQLQACLRRTSELLSFYVRPTLVQQRFNQGMMEPLQTAAKEESAKAFLHWVRSLNPLTMVVY